MWLPWFKIARRNSSTVLSISPTFSFKDIEALLREEEPTAPPKPQSPFFRRSLSSRPLPPTPLSLPFSNENRIVLYYTTLRVVRRTFEDCRSVRSILSSFRVAIDERDLSMDSRFVVELEGILGGRKKLSLPLLFIGGRLIGGADEIRRLHETGELKKLVEGFPSAALDVCRSCGGVRFVLCQSCNGSHKCSKEKGGGFRICPACNENGLVRCTDCLL